MSRRKRTHRTAQDIVMAEVAETGVVQTNGLKERSLLALDDMGGTFC